MSCGQCRLSCFGRSDGRKGYAYYVCRGKLHPVISCRDSKCAARLIPAAALDELVWADLCALLQEPEQITAALGRAQAGAWLPQELTARRTTLRQAQSALTQQVDRLTEAYLAQVIPLEEYKRRRGELEARQEVLVTQLAQVAAHAERAHEVAGLVAGLEEFCARVREGLAAADFAQRRALVELLIDRVVVTGEEVEIRYVIPTSLRGVRVRFCYLRLDYFYVPPRAVNEPHLVPAQAFWRYIGDVDVPVQ